MQGSKKQRMMRSKWSVGMYLKDFLDSLRRHLYSLIPLESLNAARDNIIFDVFADHAAINADLTSSILDSPDDNDPRLSKKLNKFTFSGLETLSQEDALWLVDNILSSYNKLKSTQTFSGRSASDSFMKQLKEGLKSDCKVQQKKTMAKLIGFVRRGHLKEPGYFGKKQGLTLHKAVMNALDAKNKEEVSGGLKKTTQYRSRFTVSCLIDSYVTSNPCNQIESISKVPGFWVYVVDYIKHKVVLDEKVDNLDEALKELDSYYREPLASLDKLIQKYSSFKLDKKYVKFFKQIKKRLNDKNSWAIAKRTHYEYSQEQPPPFTEDDRAVQFRDQFKENFESWCKDKPQGIPIQFSDELFQQWFKENIDKTHSCRQNEDVQAIFKTLYVYLDKSSKCESIKQQIQAQLNVISGKLFLPTMLSCKDMRNDLETLEKSKAEINTLCDEIKESLYKQDFINKTWVSGFPVLSKAQSDPLEALKGYKKEIDSYEPLIDEVNLEECTSYDMFTVIEAHANDTIHHQGFDQIEEILLGYALPMDQTSQEVNVCQVKEAALGFLMEKANADRMQEKSNKEQYFKYHLGRLEKLQLGKVLTNHDKFCFKGLVEKLPNPMKVKMVAMCLIDDRFASLAKMCNIRVDEIVGSMAKNKSHLYKRLYDCRGLAQDIFKNSKNLEAFLMGDSPKGIDLNKLELYSESKLTHICPYTHRKPESDDAFAKGVIFGFIARREVLDYFRLSGLGEYSDLEVLITETYNKNKGSSSFMVAASPSSKFSSLFSSESLGTIKEIFNAQDPIYALLQSIYKAKEKKQENRGVLDRTLIDLLEPHDDKKHIGDDHSSSVEPHTPKKCSAPFYFRAEALSPGAAPPHREACLT